MRRRPRSIILVRHGESLGNVDVGAYSRIPDNQMELTPEGERQANETGRQLAQVIKETENIIAFVSPYKRTQDTFACINSQLGDRVKRIICDPDIREQDFGNYQNPEVMKQSAEERKKFGRFFYRFPNGESGADVYTRMELFMTSLFRHMDLTSRARHDVVLIVTHGITMRMFMMRFLRWTVEEYEQVWNPGNCEAWMLTRDAEGEFFLTCNSKFECLRTGPQKSQKGETLKHSLSDRLRSTHNRAHVESDNLISWSWWAKSDSSLRSSSQSAPDKRNGRNPLRRVKTFA